jgi:hypothetical protein
MSKEKHPITITLKRNVISRPVGRKGKYLMQEGASPP